MTARVTLINHGATAAVRAGAFPRDEDLEPGQVEKIAGLGWSSPRAREVLLGPELRIRATAGALRLTGFVDDDLRDCDYGRWRGLSLAEVGASDPEGLMAWLTDVRSHPHGGESIAEMMERTRGWMEKRTGAGHTLAVTHPGVIRSAVVLAMGAPAEAFWRVEVAPFTLTDLRWNGRVWSIRCLGCGLRTVEAQD